MELIHKDGSVTTQEVAVPKGEPQVPVTWEDMRGKLGSCAEGFYSTGEQQKLFDLFYAFEKLSDHNELLNLLCSK